MADLFFAPDGTLLPNDAPNTAVQQAPQAQPSAAQPYFAQDGTVLMEPPPYANALASADERQAAGESIHPLEQEALKYQRLHDLGYKFQGGQAYRPAGWVDVGRTEAYAEPPEQFAERQALAERGRGIVRDERDIQYEENERLRAIAEEQAAQAKERAFAKESRLQTIDDEVRRESVALDSQMQQYRRMVSEGIDPWKAYGGGNFSGKLSAALSLATAALGTQEGADRSMRLFETLTKNEIQRQMYEMETQGSTVDNTYGRLRNLYGDRDQAEAALNALMLDAAKYEIERSLLETADPAAKANADKLILGIDQMLLEQNDAFRVRAQGKVTQRYDQGQAASSGGMVRMTPEEIIAWGKGRSTISGTEASTQKTYAEAGKIASEQQRTMDPNARPEFKGQTAIVNAYSEANAVLSGLNKLSKMRGEGGLDLNTRKYIAQSKDWTDDRVPNRGLVDTVAKTVNPQTNVEYDRAMRQVLNSFRRAMTGLAAPLGEIQKIESDVDSKIETRHLAGLQALAEMTMEVQDGAVSVMAKPEQAWLENRRRETVSSAIAPESRNGKERGK